jgi:restriction system protein
LRRRGYAVVETGGGGADGGVDVVLRKDGQKHLVQAKHWKARQIGVTTVRELKGVIATTGAAGGFLVASGTFTRDAQTFAQSAGIELIDGPALTRMIEEVRRSAGPPANPVRKEPIVHNAAPLECPKCGSAMVRRTAKRGSNAGGQFWGCSTYPRCRATVAIDPG